MHSRKKGRRIEGKEWRALIEPEKDPASKFIESSHDFSRSGTENAGEREIRALVESGRGTTFHIDRVPSSLAPFDQALGSNTTLCPIKPMGAGVASVHASGEERLLNINHSFSVDFPQVVGTIQ